MQELELPNRESIAHTLRKALSEVQFAYVFGSFLQRSFTAESDIDLAVEFGEPLGWDARVELATELQSSVGHEVDIIDLHTADPIIRMQVLRYGKLLIETDATARRNFEIRTISEYLDFKIDRAPIEAKMLQRHDA
jgi:predicted nucleotidyltransferase